MQQQSREMGERQISGRIRSNSSNLMSGPQGRRPMTRSMIQNQQLSPEASKLKFAVFLKAVLDF